MSSNRPRRGRLSTSLLALAAVAALTVAFAAPAGAVPGSGDATIVAADHSKGRTLSGQGVKLLAGAGANTQGNKLNLPIDQVGPAGTQPAARSGAAITFKSGKKSVALTGIRFELAAGTLVGNLGGSEIPVFWLGAPSQVNSTSGSVGVSAGKLRLTSQAAELLQDKLGLERALVRKGVGMIWLAAQANPVHVTKQIASGVLDWGFLTSWREYIYKELGPGSVGSITVEGGAAIHGEVAKPGAFFSFPGSGGSFHEGLYGATSTLALNTQGSVKFAKPGHCIVEIRFTNLQVSINGASSSIVGDLTYDVDKAVGKSCENQPPVSAPGTTIATLDASGVAPVHSGNTVSWTNLPATLTAAAATPFAPQYKAGQVLDPVRVSVGIG
jgi:hypothetical protein